MNLNTLYNFLRYVSNKEQIGDVLSPSSFNVMLEAANVDYFKKTYGLPEEYQPGMPLPRVSYDITQKIIDSMRPFKKNKTILTDNNGEASLPSDYIHFTGMIRSNYINEDNCETSMSYASVEEMKDAQLADRLSNSITVPTKNNPVFIISGDGMSFYPKEKATYTMYYIRIPKKPVFAYTIEGDQVVYDEEGSTQIEWGEEVHMDIARLMLAYAGINMRDRELQAYSERFKQEGA